MDIYWTVVILFNKLSRTCVVRCAQVLDAIQRVLEEVVAHAVQNVVVVDFDVIIPIGAGLFVPESSRVHQLVDHDADVNAALTQ